MEDWGDAHQIRKHPRLPANHQKSGKRHATDSLSQLSEGTSPASPRS